MAQKKQSKKYGLTRLAVGWRAQLLASVASVKLKTAVAILSATGCRPSELERGVVVQLKSEKLYIGIHGSKVDEEKGRGQLHRLIQIDTQNPWGQFLLNQATNSEQNGFVASYDAGSISQRLREKSKLLWPKRRPLISAYTYRHFLTKSMKESGESAEMIAKMLGHASDYSATVYGRAGGGKKCANQHGIISAEASNPIRHSPKSEKIAQLISKRSLKSASVEKTQT
jgi:integrase